MREFGSEREKMRFLKERADYIIDTSYLLTRELKQEVEKIFVDNQEFCNLMVSVLSFGFKYGIPADADLVFDVRFLPNPYYVDELRPLTGMEDSVFEYVMNSSAAQEFADKLGGYGAFFDSSLCERGKDKSCNCNRLYRRKASFCYPCKRTVWKAVEKRTVWIPS